MKWKARILGRRTLLRTRFFWVVEERVSLRGKKFPYQYRPHPGVVHIVALTRQGQAILVRQYRHPVRKALLEFPAGVMEAGESPLAAAKRELVEETGCAARRWIRLGGWHPAPASSNMRTHYFLALNARRVRAPSLDTYEFLRVERRPFAELVRRFARMKDVTINTLMGIALAFRYLNRR